jgi:uncharacterized delta-60 repeat protein
MTFGKNQQSREEGETKMKANRHKKLISHVCCFLLAAVSLIPVPIGPLGTGSANQELSAIDPTESSEVIHLNAPWDPGLTRYPRTYDNNGRDANGNLFVPPVWEGHCCPHVPFPDGHWGAVDLFNDDYRGRIPGTYGEDADWQDSRKVRAAHRGVATFEVVDCSDDPARPIKTNVSITNDALGIQTHYTHLRFPPEIERLANKPSNPPVTRIVDAGDVIGFVRSDDERDCREADPHLHFGVYQDADGDGRYEGREGVDLRNVRLDGQIIFNGTESPILFQLGGRPWRRFYWGEAIVAQSSQFALARYNANGSLDTTFDNNGKVLTNFTSSASEEALAMAVDASGKVVVAGFAFVGDGRQFALARYNADGSLDTTFDGDGKVLTDFTSSTSEEARAIALQTDGKIVVAGFANVGGTGRQFAVARYQKDGSLDTSFSGDGKDLTDFTSSTDEEANAIAIDASGRIIVAGFATVGGSQQFALARLNHDGSLDTSFDSDGKVLTNFSPSTSEEARAIALQTDGKIVAAGSAFVGTGHQFALARYTTSGGLDTSFNGSGMLLFDNPFSPGEEATAIRLQTDGKIVVAGSARTLTTGHIFQVVRLNVNGSLDASFNGSGLAFNGFPSSTNAEARAVAIQNGKITIAGFARIADGNQFALMRYNANGSLDTTFDGDGKVLTDFVSTPNEQANAITITASGKIVVAGDAVFYGGA